MHFSVKFDQRVVGFRSTITEELPGISHLSDHVHVHLMDKKLILISTGLSFYLTSVPTRLMAAINTPFAAAEAGCSSSHRYCESPATVAEGL